MKRTISTSLFILFGFLAILPLSTHATEAEIGKVAPDFTLPSDMGDQSLYQTFLERRI